MQDNNDDRKEVFPKTVHESGQIARVASRRLRSGRVGSGRVSTDPTREILRYVDVARPDP